MILCDKKTCVNNEWDMFYGMLCHLQDVSIKNCKCANFIKSTPEQQKEKRKRYGYKNLY